MQVDNLLENPLANTLTGDGYHTRDEVHRLCGVITRAWGDAGVSMDDAERYWLLNENVAVLKATFSNVTAASWRLGRQLCLALCDFNLIMTTGVPCAGRQDEGHRHRRRQAHVPRHLRGLTQQQLEELTEDVLGQAQPEDAAASQRFQRDYY